jgi:hypothetical protein
MCKKCQELSAKIERCRRILARSDDRDLAAGLGKLIEELEAEKAALQQQPS